MNIVLLGCHGAGKTTLGQALADHLGVPFHDEMGRRLAADPERRAAGTTAADPQSAFDDTLFALELERDRHWAERGTRVVETWHPGNLAFALRRSPDVVARRLLAIREACRAPSLAVVVTAPAEVLAARQTEAGSLVFFQDVAADAMRLARELGLPTLGIVDTSRLGPQALARLVATRIQARSQLQQQEAA